MHYIFPIQQIVHPPISYLGVVISILGIVLNIYSVRYLERQNTTSDFHETANRLVVTGPYRISRNPIYLSGAMLSLGIAIFLGSLITFMVPILIILILNNLYIPNEELRLEQIFGQEFLEYKQRVRRWL